MINGPALWAVVRSILLRHMIDRPLDKEDINHLQEATCPRTRQKLRIWIWMLVYACFQYEFLIVRIVDRCFGLYVNFFIENTDDTLLILKIIWRKELNVWIDKSRNHVTPSLIVFKYFFNYENWVWITVWMMTTLFWKKYECVNVSISVKMSERIKLLMKFVAHLSYRNCNVCPSLTWRVHDVCPSFTI